jgi:hypothetical protein
MSAVELPAFHYHPDPIASGSIEPSTATCACCQQARGFVYTASAYGEDEHVADICPWCIADGSAHRKLKVTFVDAHPLSGKVSHKIIDEVTCQTPGFATWQSEEWPVCCDDACAFLTPIGITEIRRDHYEWEGFLMGHIVHQMQISGGAARQLMESLNKDQGPTAYAFLCLHCNRHHFFIDYP